MFLIINIFIYNLHIFSFLVYCTFRLPPQDVERSRNALLYCTFRLPPQDVERSRNALLYCTFRLPPQDVERSRNALLYCTFRLRSMGNISSAQVIQISISNILIYKLHSFFFAFFNCHFNSCFGYF